MVAGLALAGEPAAAQMSHQGQDINDHVVLRDGSYAGRGLPVCPPFTPFAGRALYRVFPDGTKATDPFTVPAGRQLVITDVEWMVDATAQGQPLTPGETVGTQVQVGSVGTFNTVFRSSTVQVGPESGRVFGNEQLSTGFAVAPNTAICPGSAAFGAGLVRSVRLLEVVLRGYLIDAH